MNSFERIKKNFKETPEQTKKLLSYGFRRCEHCLGAWPIKNHEFRKHRSRCLKNQEEFVSLNVEREWGAWHESGYQVNGWDEWQQQTRSALPLTNPPQTETRLVFMDGEEWKPFGKIGPGGKFNPEFLNGLEGEICRALGRGDITKEEAQSICSAFYDAAGV